MNAASVKRRLRPLAKTGLGRAATLPPFSIRTRQSLRGRVDVIYYHYVGPDTPWFHEFYGETTAERLERDLRLLSRWFTFAPLQDVVRGTAAGGSGDKPPLAITFDDGFRLGEGLDVLERFGVAATTFVITDCVGNEQLMWRNKLSAVLALRPSDAVVAAYGTLGLAPIAAASELMGASRDWPMGRKDELADALWAAAEMPPLAEFMAEHTPYLDWDDLAAWRGRGHGVGLHTASHPHCGRLSAEEAEAEVVVPAALLRSRLGLDWLPLSYPFGSRLDGALEADLFRRGVFDCAFGIRGFSPTGTPAQRLERASAEHMLGYHVFGSALAGRPGA